MEIGAVKQRDKTMDIARGIAILVMIMGHTGCTIPHFDFSMWYHAWHMPVFYIVSGYFFSGRDSDIRSYIAKAARQLLVPFAFWLAFDYAYYFLQTYDLEYIKNNLLAACFVWPTGCNGYPATGALWFLIALFSLKAINIVMTRLFTNQIVFYTMSAVVGFCGMTAAQKGMYLPLGIDAALVGVPFMAVGELLRKYSSRRLVKELMHMRWYVFVPTFIIVNWLFFYNGNVNFRGTYTNIILTYFNAIMGSILLFNISGLMAEKLTKFSPPPNTFGSGYLRYGGDEFYYLRLPQSENYLARTACLQWSVEPLRGRRCRYHVLDDGDRCFCRLHRYAGIRGQ